MRRHFFSPLPEKAAGTHRRARRSRALHAGVNSRVKFYAPGLTGAVLLFRPDAVVLAAPAAHLHAGPLSRAFRGLRLVSFLPRGNAGALCRLARRRCAASIDAPFPPGNASEETQRAFLDAFVAALVS